MPRKSHEIWIGKWNAEPGNLKISRFYPVIYLIFYHNGTQNADLDCYNGTQLNGSIVSKRGYEWPATVKSHGKTPA